MKKTLLFFITIFTLIFSLCACSQQDLEDMTSGESDGYATIVWGNKTMYYTAHYPNMVSVESKSESLMEIRTTEFMN